MPTYEYQCEACGGRFDKFQSITSAPTKKCDLCGKSKARRLISAGGGLIFKGSGFYITDYRSDSYKSDAKSDSGSPTPATSDTKSTSDKPATPAPPAAATTTAPAPAATASGKAAVPASKK